MIVTIVLSISVLLQFIAAILALRLIRVTEKSGSWLLIVIAIILMGIRRSITLFRLISGDLMHHPDLTAELVALVISVLMVLGIAWIVPLFRVIRDSEKMVQHSKIWLIVTGMFGLLCILVWFNEILDFPHILLGAPHTPFNWREALIEMVVITIVGFFVVSKIIHYITERKKAEEHIRHLNSVLKAIRNVNQLIIVEKNKDSLLQKTCEILIEARGYDAAWLGFLKDGKTFAMVKGAGFGEDVIRFSEYVMKGEHPFCIKKALAEKNPFVVVEKSKECGDCFFRDACVGKEAGIIRVEYAGRFFGLLAILFAPDVTIDEEEKGLLKEVANDIAFALYSMEIEEARKQVEEALRESEEKMRTILDSMPDVVLQLAPNLEIIWANKATLKLNPHAIGQLCYKALPGRNDECPGCPIVKALKTGKIQRGIVHLQSVKGVGESYWDDVGIPIKDTWGKITSIVKLARNVTERKKAEEELKKLYAKLKESQVQLIQSEKMSAVGTFVAGVAHELNNPITAILHFTQYCIKHTSEEDRLYTILQDIEKETRSCIDTIQNLLTFSHMQRKEAYLKENLNTILSRVLKLLSYRIEKDNISISKHIAIGTPGIMMNVNNMQQVFLNLLNNALDALKESKQKKIDINILCEGKYVKVIIADSGCGIAPENIDNIFDPFFTTKPVGKGTGMGLSLCQSIIKAHNGEITCESVPGQGTKFKILLPATTENATAKGAKGAEGAKNATTENTEKSRGRRDATTEPQKAQKKEKNTENVTAKGAKERKRHRECNRKGR